MSLSATLPAFVVTDTSGPPLAPRRRGVIAASSGDRAAVLLAHALPHPAAPRARLPGRVRLARRAGRAADRPRWPPAGDGFPRPRRGALRLARSGVPPDPEPLLARRVRP